MDDKELLVFAAKAAGVETEELSDGGVWYWKPFATCRTQWNPLTDDGDAFRLAVQLGLLGVPKHGIRWFYALGGDNPLADTRRAIVRVAANIGKEKEEREKDVGNET